MPTSLHDRHTTIQALISGLPEPSYITLSTSYADVWWAGCEADLVARFGPPSQLHLGGEVPFARWELGHGCLGYCFDLDADALRDAIEVEAEVER